MRWWLREVIPVVLWFLGAWFWCWLVALGLRSENFDAIWVGGAMVIAPYFIWGFLTHGLSLNITVTTTVRETQGGDGES